MTTTTSNSFQATEPAPQLGVPARVRGRRSSPHEIVVRILALLMARPRTRAEISEALGYSRDRQSVYRYVNEIYDMGLVYISGWYKPATGQPAPVFAMQQSLFGAPDMPRPGRAQQ